MKRVFLFVTLFLSCATARGANEGNIAPDQLAAMGLGQMHVLLDHESKAIRVRACPTSRFRTLSSYVRGANRFEQQAANRPWPFYRPVSFVRVVR